MKVIRPVSLLYLHGFLSSPQSKKAQFTVDYCNRTAVVDSIIVPTLPWGPAAAVSDLCNIVQAHAEQDIILIGSSLGGYYATFLSEKYGIPAALINPAVGPFDYWTSYLGEHKSYYGDEVHTVTEQHIVQLKNLNVPNLKRPENIMLLVETGDETLDYRLAVDRFTNSPQIVRQNGNHSYENYAGDLPVIFDFLLSRIDPNVR